MKKNKQNFGVYGRIFKRYSGIQLITFYVILLIGNACNNPDNSSAESQSDRAGDAQEATVDKPTNNLPPLDKDVVDEVHAQIIKQSKLYFDRDEKGYLYRRSVEYNGLYSDVYYFNGKVSRVAWHDIEVGVNGQYMCYYDEAGSIQHVESFDHNGKEFNNHYYRPLDNRVVSFEYWGQFEGNKDVPYEMASYDEQSVYFGLEEYQKILATAEKLKSASLADKVPSPGTRYYQGTINAQYGIEANISLSSNWIYGQYHYTNSKSALEISGNVEDGGIELKEKDMKTEEITGYFTGKFTADGKLKGTWSNADKTKQFPFELSPSETYTSVDGTTIKGLLLGKPEIFYQNVKTNYFDLPSDEQERASEILGSAELQTIAVNDISFFKDYLEKEFVLNDGFEHDEFDDNGNRPVLQYFNDVYLPLPDFVSKKERHDGYYADMANKLSDEKRLSSYLIYRIDRSSDNIFAIWYLFKDEFFQVIDNETYVRLEFDQTVKDLLQSFDHIEKFDDSKERLNEAYQSVDSLNHRKLDPGYDAGAYGTSIGEQYTFLMPLMKDDKSDYKRQLWAYSFWMRRNHEGNVEVVSNILKEINDHYLSD